VAISEEGLDELENYLIEADITQVMEATWMGGGGHPSKFMAVLAGGGGALGKAENASAEAPTMIQRERAAWLLARTLEWTDLVAATVLRHVEAPSGPCMCSLQMIWPAYSPGVAEDTFPEEDRWRAGIFVPADPSHGQQRLKLVDHGHAFELARPFGSPFFSAFSGQEIPSPYDEALENLAPGVPSMEELLPQDEYGGFVDRMNHLRDGVLNINEP